MGAVIGVDPASLTSGVAFVKDGRLMSARIVALKAKSKRKENPILRCCRMAAAIEQAIIEMAVGFGADAAQRKTDLKVVIETPGSQTSGRGGGAMVTLGASVGAIAGTLIRAGFNVAVVNVADWSRLDGPVCLSKEDRGRRVLAKLGAAGDSLPPDALDAVGVAAVGDDLFPRPPKPVKRSSRSRRSPRSAKKSRR